MKRLVLAITVICAILAGSSAYGRSFGTGTFCSAKTADGKWGFIFGQRTVGENCLMVKQGLSQVTNTPITKMRRGYYNLNGVNAVLIRCGFQYRNIIKSFGGYALQNAYMTAKNSGLSHCIFMVNGR